MVGPYSANFLVAVPASVKNEPGMSKVHSGSRSSCVSLLAKNASSKKDISIVVSEENGDGGDDEGEGDSDSVI
jgi:hypothetical protein